MAASAKALKLRIKSVDSIKRITKTMKMIAATKLKGFQTRMESSRPIAAACQNIHNQVVAEKGDEAPTGTELIVPITSDRGLCGGVNSQVNKFVRIKIREEKTDGNYLLATVGDKARTSFYKTNASNMAYQAVGLARKPTTFLQACCLAEDLASLEGANYSTLVYQQFKSAIAYELSSTSLPNIADYSGDAKTPFTSKYEVECDDEDGMLADLQQFNLAVQLFSGLLESATCEQSARMQAMDGASKNCGELIDKLTTQMNRARQASITTELCEIVAGAEAIAQ
jgi:ATP synthase F1 gamma subunit